MYIKNNTLKQFYRVVFLFLCELGMVLQYAIVARIGKIEMLTCYYTMLSNMLCFLYFAILVIIRPEGENQLITGGVVVSVAITGIVYHTMLNGAMEAGVGAVAQVTTTDIVANTMVHTVVPVMTFIDYLLFSPKGKIRWFHPFIWLSVPVAYLIFIMIRAEVGTGMFAGFSGMSRYPYPFIDVDAYGWNMVLIMMAVMLVGCLVLNFALFVLDKLLGKFAKVKPL